MADTRDAIPGVHEIAACFLRDAVLRVGGLPLLVVVNGRAAGETAPRGGFRAGAVGGEVDVSGDAACGFGHCFVVGGGVVEEDGDTLGSFHHDCGTLSSSYMIIDIGEEYTELLVSIAVGATDKRRKIDVAKHILESSDVAACPASIRISDYLSCSSPASTSPSSLQQRIAVRVRLDSLRPRVHIADSFLCVGRLASDVPRK